MKSCAEKCDNITTAPYRARIDLKHVAELTIWDPKSPSVASPYHRKRKVFGRGPVLAVFAGVIVMLIFSCIMAQKTMAQPAEQHMNNPIGFVRSTFDDVRICRYSELRRTYSCRQAKTGDTLYTNSHIRTGHRGRARIAYNDDEKGEPEYISIREDDGAFVRYTRTENGKFSTVTMGPSTTLSLHRHLEEVAADRAEREEAAKQEWEASTWNPFAGKRSAIFILIRDLNKATPPVWRPSGTGFGHWRSVCGSRGTDYTYERDPQTGEQIVAVLDGTLACERDSKPEVEVSAGEKFVINDEGAEVQPLTEREAQALQDKSALPAEADTLSVQNTPTFARTLIVEGIEEALDRAESAIARMGRMITATTVACEAAVNERWTEHVSTAGIKLEKILEDGDREFMDDEVGRIAQETNNVQFSLIELLSIVQRIVGRTTDAASEACAASETRSHAQTSRAAALRAQNLMQLASQTYAQSIDALLDTIDTIEPTDLTEVELEQRLRDRKSNIKNRIAEERLCALPPAHPWASSDAITTQLAQHDANVLHAEAVSLLNAARETIGQVEHDRLTWRAEHLARSLSHEKRRTYACEATHRRSAQTCIETLREIITPGIYVTGPRSTVGEIISRRRDWGEKLRTMVANIDTQLEEARARASEAAACVRDTEQREAAELDPGTAGGSCDTLVADLDIAREDYAREGGMADAKARLIRLRETLNALPEDANCPEVDRRVEDGLDKIDRIERVQERGEEAIASCDLKRISDIGSRLQAVSHPALATMRSLLTRLSETAARNEDAKRAYNSGDLVQAETLLRNAHAATQPDWPPSCQEISNEIADNLARVKRLRDGIEAARAAISACEVDSIEKWIMRFKNLSNSAVNPIKAELASKREYCADQAQAGAQMAANELCRKEIGENVIASPEQGIDGKTACICAAGYRWNDRRDKCIKAATEAKLAASREAHCLETRGTGYYAGTPAADGTYYCLPKRKTANKWCKDNNAGSGWSAGPISSLGGFSCIQSERERKAAARAECRQQARQNGKVYAYTQFLNDGRYSCRWCEPGYVYRDRSCYPRSATQQQLVCPSGYVLRGRSCYPTRQPRIRPAPSNRNFCIVNGRNICRGSPANPRM